MKKILVIRFSSIGDIVLTTPILRCLKTQSDEVEVHYLTKEKYIDVIAQNPYIDKLHVLEAGGSLLALIKTLRKENFHFVADLHNNLRTRIIKLLLFKPSKSFDKLNLKKWLLVNWKVNKLPNIHIVDRYFSTMEPLGIINDDAGLDYFIPEKDEIEDGWLPKPFQQNYATLVIGGQHGTKKLPVDRLIELCHVINKPIILIGGKEDQPVADQVEAFYHGESDPEMNLKLDRKTVIFNGCGKFNLNQSAWLIKEGDEVYTHDTGMMHIAAAFKKTVFSIWGNTVPEFGMYPYKTSFVIWEVKDLDCRPCSKIGFDKCPKGHFKCMKDIKFGF